MKANLMLEAKERYIVKLIELVRALNLYSKLKEVLSVSTNPMYKMKAFFRLEFNFKTIDTQCFRVSFLDTSHFLKTRYEFKSYFAMCFIRK
jgi:hypothetical protein